LNGDKEKRFGIVNYFEIEMNNGEIKVLMEHCPKCESILDKYEPNRCKWVDCNWNIKREEIIGSVLLIGSMRFNKLFFELEKQLTFFGYNIIMPYIDGIYNKSNYSKEQWNYLELHILKKIDLVDAVFVINDKMDVSDEEGYIGEHTKEEILYTILTKSNSNYEDWWKYIGKIYKIDVYKILEKDNVSSKIQKWNNWGMNFHSEEIMNLIKAL